MLITLGAWGEISFRGLSNVSSILSKNPDVSIKSFSQDQYGRYLVDVYYGEEKFLNQELLDSRLAAPAS